MTPEERFALKEAHMLAEASKVLALRGNEAKAQQAQERAEERYEDAGLDPAWHDDGELHEAKRRMDPQEKLLHPEFFYDEVAELSDEYGAEDGGSGILCRLDELVELPR